MEIPRHWRLRQQRYQMVGEECPHCEEKIFPPRDICPMCGRGTLENNLGTRIVMDKENNSGDKPKNTALEKYYEEKGGSRQTRTGNEGGYSEAGGKLR